MKKDFEVSNSKEFNKLANDFLKLQIARANDISLLHKVLAKAKDSCAGETQYAISIRQEEGKRRQHEDGILVHLASFRDLSESKLKVLSTLARKTDKISSEAMPSEPLFLLSSQLNSST